MNVILVTPGLQTDFDRVSWKQGNRNTVTEIARVVYEPISIGLVGNEVTQMTRGERSKVGVYEPISIGLVGNSTPYGGVSLAVLEFTNRFRSG